MPGNFCSQLNYYKSLYFSLIAALCTGLVHSVNLLCRNFLVQPGSFQAKSMVMTFDGIDTILTSIFRITQYVICSPENSIKYRKRVIKEKLD